MNSKDNLPNSSEKLGMQARTSFYSGINSKKKLQNIPNAYNRTNFKFFNNDIPSAIQSSYESDKFKDTIIKLKRENNKLVQEITRLKIENHKIEEEGKKNLKAVEEVLNSHSYFNFEKEDSESGVVPENAVSNLPKIQNVHSLTPEGVVKLREVYVISTLRKQLQSLKGILKLKENEIESLKANTKVSTFSKMESQHSAITNELNEMRKEYNMLKSVYDDRILKYEQLMDENTTMKNMFIKYKNHYEEAKNKVHSLEEEKKKLVEAKRICDEKILYMSKCNQTSKVNKPRDDQQDILFDLKKEIGKLTEENRRIKNDREKLNDKIKILSKDRAELATKKEHLSEENFSLRSKIDTMKTDFENQKKNLKQTHEDKNNKLQSEITKLKKEIGILKERIALDSEKYIKQQVEFRQAQDENEEKNLGESEKTKAKDLEDVTNINTKMLNDAKLNVNEEEEDVMNKSFDEKLHQSKEKESKESEVNPNPTQQLEILKEIEQESIKDFQNKMEEPLNEVENEPLNNKDISKLSGISKNLNEKSNNQSILDELNNNEELKATSSLNDEKKILSIELENSKENTNIGFMQSSSDLNKTPKKRSSIVNEPVSQIIKENLEEEEENVSVKIKENPDKGNESQMLEQEIAVPAISKERMISLLENEMENDPKKQTSELAENEEKESSVVRADEGNNLKANDDVKETDQDDKENNLKANDDVKETDQDNEGNNEE